MATELDENMISGIVKWELLRAPKRLFAAAAGKARSDRDEALNALTNLISKRFERFTVVSHVHRDASDMGRLSSKPNYPFSHGNES